MSKRRPQSLTFKSLLIENPFGLLVSVLIGAVASLAAVALLGISGWFLSAAGLASVLGTALVFDFFTPGASVRLMAILRTAGRYGEQVFSHDHLLGLLRSLRLWVWDQRVSTAPGRLHKQTRGDLLQRLVGDLDQIIKWPLAVVMPWVYSFLGCLALLGLAWWVAPVLAIPVVVFALFQLLVWPWLANRLALQSVYQMQALSIHRRSRFMSVFSSLITLTIRGHWQDYSKRLNTLDDRQCTAQAVIQRVVSRIKLAIQLTSLVLIVSLLGMSLQIVNGDLMLQETIAGPMLVALVLAALGVNELVQPMAMAFLAQGQSKVGLKRLNQLQPESSRKADSTQCTPVTSPASLQLYDFSGCYPGRVMPPISMGVYANERVRLSGKSGSGKSTLLAALAGDLESKGKAKVNGESLSLYQNESWRKKVGYLPQESIIFQQSLAANLRLGAPNASDGELLRVLSVMGLSEWVAALPNGLDTLLGAQGRDVSGGQARRIALARILLRKADVLLLDEPFDGLDRASIKRVCDALRSPEFAPNLLLYVSHVDSDLDGYATQTIEF
ncbi:amino acid ABC transporter ATP-binding/permease protein [Rhodanobacter aciditrophus]|uniref:Amino acid ABC transporter ATP-binding/permease protein n=1 Tax=Rhodanobacter aciditrophus TaxID=1623218 RepID=A0ABW4AWZ9_9GAMM